MLRRCCHPASICRARCIAQLLHCILLIASLIPVVTRMSEALPTVDHDVVVQCQHDYDAAFATGKPEEYEGARLRLVWALVHSKDSKHVTRGRDLALANIGSSGGQAKDYRYLAAVAAFKMRHYLDARREVTQLIADFPDFRQAEFLKGCIEDGVVRDGLVGLGAAAAVTGVVGFALVALLGGRRR